jgi:hypothetical protein
MPADLSVERAALRDLLHQVQRVQRARIEVIASRARLVADIAQSRELRADADFVLTLLYVKRPRE